MSQAEPTRPTLTPSSAAEESFALRSRRGVLATLRDRWHRFRNTLLESARFQRWAAGFPLTRWVAARSASKLFDICAGFVYSQVLYACVRLSVFDLLADEALPVETIAERTGLPIPNARRLMDAAVSLKLLQRRSGDRYGLGMLGAALRGNPGAARMIEHHPMLYRDLGDPVGLLRAEVRETELGRFWAYSSSDAPIELDGERVAAYSRLMAQSQQFIASDILAAYPMEKHQTLMDVGGGEGAFLVALAERTPELRLMLFDLPAVAQRARDRFEREGIAARVQVIGGDVFNDALPEGADLITLVRIIHDHDDEAALAILQSAYRALPSGGKLLVAEPMAGTRGALPMGDAYFGLYLLAMGHGRPRTPSELKSMLATVGFKSPRMVRTRRPMLTRVLVATK